jgi:hypothetical protein
LLGRRRVRALPGLDCDLAEMPPILREWSQALDVSRVTDRTAREAEYYLANYRRMVAASRHEAAFRLMAKLAVQVTPPPPLSIAPLDAVATVLRAFRDRRAARPDGQDE